MKKITILTLHLNYGGIESFVSSLCKMLENDYEIEVISTYKGDGKPKVYFSDKIKIKYLIDDISNKAIIIDSIKKVKIFTFIKEVIKAIRLLYLKKVRNIKCIKQIDSDYCITTRIFHNKLVSKYLNSNIISIATEHNYHNNDKKYINSLVKSCSKINYLVLVSSTLRDFYAPLLLKTKCIYIPNVLDKLPEKLSPILTKNLISIGRLSPEKGQDDLIEVMKLVVAIDHEVKLHLVGDGVLKSIIDAKIKAYHLENNIIIHGFLSKELYEKYMLDSSLFVMTSYTESFGLVLIEAMSYKVPCIAFDSADGARILLNHNRGILIPDRDKQQMAQTIIKLLNDEKYRHALATNGYQYCQKYLINNVKEDWLNLLK